MLHIVLTSSFFISPTPSSLAWNARRRGLSVPPSLETRDGGGCLSPTPSLTPNARRRETFVFHHPLTRSKREMEIFYLIRLYFIILILVKDRFGHQLQPEMAKNRTKPDLKALIRDRVLKSFRLSSVRSDCSGVLTTICCFSDLFCCDSMKFKVTGFGWCIWHPQMRLY